MPLLRNAKMTELANPRKLQIEWPLRPVLTSLNGDTSWLFSFPRPKADIGAKFFYHVVFEPWLTGSATQVNSWIMQVSLPELPKVPDAAAVDRIVRDIEDAAAAVAKTHGVKKTRQIDADLPIVDAILLLCHYYDHSHEPSLRGFDKRIPVVATPWAKARVASWQHFDTISLIPDFASSAGTWQTPELHPEAFPSWLTAIFIPGRGEQFLLGALVWTNEDNIHEAIFICHHGPEVKEEPFEALLNAQPPLERLALMHPLKEVHAPLVVDFAGAKGGLALYRKLGEPKYWVVYHDMVTNYTGLVHRLLQIYDTPRTLEWALEREQKTETAGEGQNQPPNLVSIENGGQFVLG